MGSIPTQVSFKPSKAEYQRTLKIVDEPQQPVVDFPAVLEPDKPGADLHAVLEATRTLAAKPSDTDNRNQIRRLLDTHGGAINFKNMPMRSAQDFSDFLVALAGEGDHAWYPHKEIGMEVLRKSHCKHVVNVNEGPPSHVIMWHNDFSASPHHPAYLVFFCLSPPETGGQTAITPSIALYDRLEKECPRFIEDNKTKGISYFVTHETKQVDGIVFGNGLYKDTAFGPLDDRDVNSMSEDEKRDLAEGRIKDLARIGGWYEGAEDDWSLPVWQRRGFSWTWREDGSGLDLFQRVPGVRIHPTQKRGSVFNSLSTRYTNASTHKTFEPPHTYTKEDGTKATVLPPLYAGLEKDEPIPKPYVDKMDELQTALSSEVAWEVGDVLVLDNLAVQHARWPWTGDRRILASFWDGSGLKAEPFPVVFRDTMS